MLIAVALSIVAVVLASLIHHEVLYLLYVSLPPLRMASRSKLLIVIVGTFVAHFAEIAVYGVVFYVMVRLGRGELAGVVPFSFEGCMYFSAETYTSLGFGDIAPRGPLRLLAGVEALNGLLLIGWSASFAYLAMERFWRPGDEKP